MEKIKFQSGSSSLFFRSLNKEVGEMIERNGLLKKARKILYMKTVFYIILFAGAYSSLFFIDYSSFINVAGNFCSLFFSCWLYELKPIIISSRILK